MGAGFHRHGLWVLQNLQVTNQAGSILIIDRFFTQIIKYFCILKVDILYIFSFTAGSRSCKPDGDIEFLEVHN